MMFIMSANGRFCATLFNPLIHLYANHATLETTLWLIEGGHGGKGPNLLVDFHSLLFV